MASKKDFDLSRSQIEYLIDEWVLNKKHREIIRLRLIDGMTYESIAEQVDMSVTQVKKIVYKSQEKVFTHAPDLKENGTVSDITASVVI